MTYTLLLVVTLVVCTASFVSLSLCISVNVTIDDQNGDASTGKSVNYSTAEWNQGNGCSFCTAKVDPSETLGQTWHDGTYTPGTSPLPYAFTLEFDGTAIWIYFILENGVHTEMQFSVDGQDTGSPFVFDGTSGDPQFLYNQTVFSVTGLDPGVHTVEASMTGTTTSQALFDWAEYTLEQVDSVVPSTSAVVISTSTQTVNASTSSSAISSGSPSTSSSAADTPSASSDTSTIVSFSSPSIKPSSSTSVNIPPNSSDTSSASVPTSSTPIDTSSLENGSSRNYKVTVGVAVGIAVPAIIISLLGFWLCRRYRRAQQSLPLVPSKPSNDAFHRILGSLETIDPFTDHSHPVTHDSSTRKHQGTQDHSHPGQSDTLGTEGYLHHDADSRSPRRDGSILSLTASTTVFQAPSVLDIRGGSLAFSTRPASPVSTRGPGSADNNASRERAFTSLLEKYRLNGGAGI